MFRVATAQNTPRARPPVGSLTPLAIPAKGINARDSLALMGPEYAISLVNVLCEPYGLRTRRGYTEWAKNLPPLNPPNVVPVATMMHYYPATAVVAVLDKLVAARSIITRLLVEGRAASVPPVGKLFAARGGKVFDVTAGGIGPWVEEAVVAGASDYWTWMNFQNVAGSFLVAANNAGGYAIYNGAAWSMPVAGAGVGQIDNVDPALFCHVVEHKKRLWFVKKGSTSGWYLPVGQITGAATEFNFGEQFRSGGHLVALASWTVDGGVGIDDHLVAVGSQGDIVVYKGDDPDDPSSWALRGVWHVGALPVGRRSVFNTGGDVHILSQFGITPLSVLLNSSTELGVIEQRRVSYLIGPLIARLMRDYSALQGWQIRTLPKEELIVLGVPREAQQFGGQYFAMKVTSGGWSLVKDVPYASFVTIDNAIFAGTFDGRVVRAFDGPLDNVLIGETTGAAIQCQVTPAFQPLGSPGAQKRVLLIRPTFITTITPTLRLRILLDYGPPKPANVPTLPDLAESKWNEDLWNVGQWSGVQDPIHEWLGCHGVGFAATAQLDYKTGGDTVLAALDFWTEQGGVM